MINKDYIVVKDPKYDTHKAFVIGLDREHKAMSECFWILLPYSCLRQFDQLSRTDEGLIVLNISQYIENRAELKLSSFFGRDINDSVVKIRLFQKVDDNTGELINTLFCEKALNNFKSTEVEIVIKNNDLSCYRALCVKSFDSPESFGKIVQQALIEAKEELACRLFEMNKNIKF